MGILSIEKTGPKLRPNTCMQLSPRAAQGRQEFVLRVVGGRRSRPCHAPRKARRAPPPGAADSQDVRPPTRM
jgi:hypothetical protein